MVSWYAIITDVYRPGSFAARTALIIQQALQIAWLIVLTWATVVVVGDLLRRPAVENRIVDRT